MRRKRSSTFTGAFGRRALAPEVPRNVRARVLGPHRPRQTYRHTRDASATAPKLGTSRMTVTVNSDAFAARTATTRMRFPPREHLPLRATHLKRFGWSRTCCKISGAKGPAKLHRPFRAVNFTCGDAAGLPSQRHAHDVSRARARQYSAVHLCVPHRVVPGVSPAYGEGSCA
jgi:hypothetical protein